MVGTVVKFALSRVCGCSPLARAVQSVCIAVTLIVSSISWQVRDMMAVSLTSWWRSATVAHVASLTQDASVW
jgi:hypothetical protein